MGSLTKKCKITFYGQIDFNGQKVEYHQDAGSVDFEEHSIQTSGNCCWRIFEKKGFQGEHEDVDGKHFPEFQAISVKKRACGGGGDEYEYDY